jgi:hypothetical protein
MLRIHQVLNDGNVDWLLARHCGLWSTRSYDKLASRDAPGLATITLSEVCDIPTDDKGALMQGSPSSILNPRIVFTHNRVASQQW